MQSVSGREDIMEVMKMNDEIKKPVAFLHYPNQKAIPCTYISITTIKQGEFYIFNKGEQVYLENGMVRVISFKEKKKATMIIPTHNIISITYVTGLNGRKTDEQ